MMKWLFSALTGLCLFSAHAQNPPLNEAGVRRAFVEDFVKTFADEVTAMQANGDFRDIYGYFLPAEDRKAIFKGWKDQQITAKGTKLIITRHGQTALEIEMLDIFEQKYAVNGRAYDLRWQEKARSQKDAIQKILKQEPRKDASLPERAFDLVVPRAEAAFFVVPIAIQACLEGGCAIAMFMAQRAAVYLATNPAVQLAAAGATAAFRKTIVDALRAAGTKTAEVGRYIYLDLRTHPKIGNLMEALEKMLKLPKLTPSSVVYGTYKGLIQPPIKAAAWFLRELKGPFIGVGVGAVVLGPIVNEQLELAKKHNIPAGTAIGCILRLQSVLECASAKPSVEILAGGQSDKAIPDYWCPTEKANEFQIVTAENDKKVVRVIRVGTDGDHKGKPVGGMRYVIGADGSVDLKTIRQYSMEGGEVSRIVIPQIHEFARPRTTFLPARNDVAHMEKDMTAKIVERDRFLKASTTGETVVMEGVKTIRDHSPDPLKAASDPQAKTRDEEVAWAREVSESFKRLAPACSLLKSAQEMKIVPADKPPAKPATGVK